MKVLAAMLILFSPAAFAWNVAAIGYMQPQPQYQAPPQASYSEQYNRGYMDAYLAQQGYQPPYNAYQQGQQDAYRAQQSRGY